MVDAGDEVEFAAHYETADGPGQLHERSRFERRGSRWSTSTPSADPGPSDPGSELRALPA